MEELKRLYILVRSFDASCRMSKEQQETYSQLNEEYKKITGFRATHSVCNKESFLKKVESVINA